VFKLMASLLKRSIRFGKYSQDRNPVIRIVGKRVLAEFWACDSSVLNDRDTISQALNSAANAGGANLIDLFVHKFSPHGITGTATLAESHICIHTWPEYRYAAIDIFMCGRSNPYQALGSLGFILKPESKKITEVSAELPSQPA
jgi:S-adenosylmethionine decarboxylase